VMCRLGRREESFMDGIWRLEIFNWLVV